MIRIFEKIDSFGELKRGGLILQGKKGEILALNSLTFTIIGVAKSGVLVKRQIVHPLGGLPLTK
ncbi:MAG: hypothetical protein U9Q17_01135 [Chloroflexota bacterium]|nr:hypothetical protein [Chloroflexota bacterium]